MSIELSIYTEVQNFTHKHNNWEKVLKFVLELQEELWTNMREET